MHDRRRPCDCTHFLCVCVRLRTNNCSRLLALRCAGYDRVDLAACEAHGLQVVRVPTYAPTSVAEHAVGLMMALNRCAAGLQLVLRLGGCT